MYHAARTAMKTRFRICLHSKSAICAKYNFFELAYEFGNASRFAKLGVLTPKSAKILSYLEYRL
jgi:hypothetical protein